MAKWDDEDFEAELPKGGAGGTAAGGFSNKWEGEDEDDEVKDNWEDEEEEKKGDDGNEVKAKPKKKTLVERIAEREKAKREEYEKRKIEEEEPEITPEEQLRQQQESDLTLALETTFGDSIKDNPKTKEEYQELADNLIKNIQQHSKSEEYPVFAENIIRGICTTLTSFDLKKIKTTIDNLYLEKQKLEKGDKAKKTKGRGKAKLRLEGDNPNLYSSYVTAEYDEYDDFM